MDHYINIHDTDNRKQNQYIGIILFYSENLQIQQMSLYKHRHTYTHTHTQPAIAYTHYNGSSKYYYHNISYTRADIYNSVLYQMTNH